jgi:hypothetical protein
VDLIYFTAHSSQLAFTDPRGTLVVFPTPKESRTPRAAEARARRGERGAKQGYRQRPADVGAAERAHQGWLRPGLSSGAGLRSEESEHAPPQLAVNRGRRPLDHSLSVAAQGATELVAPVRRREHNKVALLRSSCHL